MKRIGVSRRSFVAGAAAVAALPFPMVNFGRYSVAGAAKRTYSKRAVDLVNRSLVIDMLNPVKIDFRPEVFAKPLSQGDMAEWRASGISAIHNAVGVGGPNAKEQALTFLAAWQGFAGRNSELFSLVGIASDLDRAKSQKKVAMIMGLQNADQFGTPADVALFYALGLRCAQLTYNTQNRIGSGSTERVDGGITDFGVEIIKAMNAAGMLIDVSHSGERTALDAAELSSKAIALTHTNCKALNDHPRNKSDAAIRKVAAKGGVVGITGVRMFVRDKEPTALTHLVDHIDHVAKLVGIEHVGIGTDQDLHGYDDMPADQYKKLKESYKSSYAFREKIDTEGFDHPLKIYDLTEELIRRRYSDANIALILGGNFRRLLGATWA